MASNNPTSGENAGHDHRRLDVQGRVGHAPLQIADIAHGGASPPVTETTTPTPTMPTPSHVETPGVDRDGRRLARGGELASPERESGDDEAEPHQRYRGADPRQKRAFRRQVDTRVVNRPGCRCNGIGARSPAVFTRRHQFLVDRGLVRFQYPFAIWTGRGSRVKLATRRAGPHETIQAIVIGVKTRIATSTRNCSTIDEG